jgi:tRNA nucleotidyltransferase (CCA-adding enzyme)
MNQQSKNFASDAFANLTGENFQAALEIIRVIESSGAEAWFVGGFVRDALLGRACADIDIATSAPWQQVKRAAHEAGMRTAETGTKHGTITVIANAQNETGVTGESVACEVTTFRAEGAYTDCRHPDSVSRAQTIEEDLSRRDFTINSMAWHPARGLCDPHGGMNDLHAGIIRCVGDPNARFAEDALRILRACRFCAQLGFEIDGENLAAMKRNKHLLAHVSTERITHELDCLLMGNAARKAIMQTVDVLAFVLPELAAMKGCPQRTKYHSLDVLEHCAAAVEASPKRRLCRWAALLHDAGKPAAAFLSADGTEHFYGHAHVSGHLAQGVADRLLMSNAFKAQLVTLVKNHDRVIAPSAKSVKRALAALDGNVNLMRDLLALKRADSLAHAPEFSSTAHVDEVEAELNRILEEKEAFTVKSLDISGTDLIRAGIPQGPAVGSALSAALNATINEEVPNKKQDLLAFCLALNA